MSWDEVIAELKLEMDDKHQRREAALAHCRKMIQLSSKSIKHVHRDEIDLAKQFLGEAKAISDTVRDELSSFGDLLYAGYLQDAQKEVAEAALTIAFVSGERWPTPRELGFSAQTYLNGAGEAASELRRYALDRLRAGDLEGAESLLATMDTVYTDLTTFDYPDSLTGGLRRTCDALRAVVERTRSDLTLMRVQHELTTELRAAKKPS